KPEAQAKGAPPSLALQACGDTATSLQRATLNRPLLNHAAGNSLPLIQLQRGVTVAAKSCVPPPFAAGRGLVFSTWCRGPIRPVPPGCSSTGRSFSFYSAGDVFPAFG